MSGGRACHNLHISQTCLCLCLPAMVWQHLGAWGLLCCCGKRPVMPLLAGILRCVWSRVPKGPPGLITLAGTLHSAPWPQHVVQQQHPRGIQPGLWPCVC
jgi:hypothetical protein